jgi:hypothetical protein
MADPVAVIIRFSGDPDELVGRFEQARSLWIQAQEGDYEAPVFYAACKTDDGMTVLTAWQSDAAHRAFAHQMGQHLAAVGMGTPDNHEHLRIEKLGWA